MKPFILILLFVTNLTFAETNLNSIIEILKEVESLNNPDAIGDNGKAYGVLQIHKIYVDEVNLRFGTSYTHQQMFNEQCAEEVFHLYMTYATKHFQKKYGKSPTEEDIVRMHNGGLYKGYRIDATKKYYDKYLSFKSRCKQEKVQEACFKVNSWWLKSVNNNFFEVGTYYYTGVTYKQTFGLSYIKEYYIPFKFNYNYIALNNVINYYEH